MKNLSLAFVLLFLSHVSYAAVKEQPVFGPVKYDVKQRYGKENRYREAFKAGEGLYMIQLKNGDRWSERPDLIEFSVNGERFLKLDNYEYPFLFCFVRLHPENSFELNLTDYVPSGLKRPPATPKFVQASVLPAPAGLKSFKGAFGAQSRDDLTGLLGSMRKIKSPEAAELAVSAGNLQNEVSARAEAVRKLSDRKDMNAQEFFLRLYGDAVTKGEVRAEAALAVAILGEVKHVPSLMRGLVDPDETVRVAAARALSFYKEEDTNEALTKLLVSLDAMRETALMNAVVSAGWKPVNVLLGLAESNDRRVSNAAVELLGKIGDKRAGDYLLKLLNNPGSKDIRIVIAALGKVKDERAFDPFMQMAADPAARRGKEVELGEALADLGDPRAADVIKEMAKKADHPFVRMRLSEAYKKLTGKDLK